VGTAAVGDGAVIDHGLELLPESLRAEIEDGLHSSRPAVDRIAEASSEGPANGPFAIKYMPIEYGATYQGGSPSGRLRISDRDGFTWGTGVYLTPLCHPISTGIYGRTGVVATFNPTLWRVLDCTQRANEALYLRWLQHQPLLRDVLVTDSGYVNHLLRNRFRETLRIDYVLFHPDERDAAGVYTRGTDTWMTVGDFDTSSGLLRTGWSKQFRDPRLAVILEEEFTVDSPPLTRSPVLGLTGTRPPDPVLTTDIIRSYNNRTVTRVLS
jgi:hypothetical protein